MLYPNLKYNEILFHQDHIHPDSRFTNSLDIPKFCADNYIPIDIDYSISNFDEFYLGRKSLLIDQLKLILDTNIE